MPLRFYNQITGETVAPLPWQEELRPGDFYMIGNPYVGVAGFEEAIGGELEDLMDVPDWIIVYGQILDAKGCEPGFFNVRAYSILCPEGEEGLVCIVEPTRKITQEEFEDARDAGW